MRHRRLMLSVRGAGAAGTAGVVESGVTATEL